MVGEIGVVVGFLLGKIFGGGDREFELFVFEDFGSVLVEEVIILLLV